MTGVGAAAKVDSVKRILLLFCQVLCALMLVGAPVGLVAVATTSCASSPSAYKTLAATQAATTALLNAFAEARVKGKVSDADYQKVDLAYRRYQEAFALAVIAARLNLNDATPEQVSRLADALADAITAVLGGAK